jgi:sec-independent protein translocase protein TatC
MARLAPVAHDDTLSIVDHLDELRSRLITCLIVLGVLFGFCYWQNHAILRIVNRPLVNAQQHAAQQDPNTLSGAANFDVKLASALKALQPALVAQQGVDTNLANDKHVGDGTRSAAAKAAGELSESLPVVQAALAKAPTEIKREPITLGVAEPFVTTFTVAMYASILLALPFILYEAYAFVLPAFSPRERRVALPLMLMVPFLFVAGVTFGYFAALPRAVGFLQTFNDQSFDILVRAQDYYKFSVTVLALLGLLFQIPVGVLALTRLGIVTPRQLAKNRGYVILLISVVAAIATPTPDPVTMLVAMAPMVVLFEGSIVLARVFEHRRAAAEIVDA